MRLRIRFTKLGKVRFTSHRDVARIWERTVRRAGLPVARTEGFSPRPKVHFGLALSTGHESLAEYLDVDLVPEAAAEVALEQLPARFDTLLPEGLGVTAVAEIDRRGVSLQQAVTSCTWDLDVPGLDPADAAARAEQLLSRTEVVVTRVRKGSEVTDDLRPAVVHLSAEPCPGGARFRAELATRPRGVRPGELMAALNPPLPDPIELGGRVLRTAQLIEEGGASREPLAAPDATPPTHAERRAS